ncbi:MAG TPA: tetratricopeptide repeat protein [Longimicrobiales bacterium]|nr:tetratricopeptide repeat protein [Longimicrobiales bacterium]
MAEAHRDEIAKLEALYAANPEGRVFTHLAEAYRKAGELELAVQVLEQGLQRHADSASAYIVLGRVRFDRGEREPAAQAFHRALELDSGNLVAHRFLGELAVEENAPEEALRHYREVLNRNPGDEGMQARVEALLRPAEPALEPDAPALADAGGFDPSAAATDTGVEPTSVMEDQEGRAERGFEAPGEPLAEPLAEQPRAEEPLAFAQEPLAEEPLLGAPAPLLADDDALAGGPPLDRVEVDAVGEELPRFDLSGDAPPAADSSAWAEVAGSLDLGGPRDEDVEEFADIGLLEVAAEFSALEAGSPETADDVGLVDLDVVLPPYDPEYPTAQAGEGSPYEDEERAGQAAEEEYGATDGSEALEEARAAEQARFADEAEAGPESPPDASPTGLVTETMAELYRSQGFHRRAAEVYRSLLAERSEDERLQQRLAEIEAELAPGSRGERDPESVESAFTGAGGAAGQHDTPYAWSAAEEPAGSGAPIGDYLRSLLSWRRPGGVLPEALAAFPDVPASEAAPARYGEPGSTAPDHAQPGAAAELEMPDEGEAEPAGELTLDEPVPESGWTPDELLGEEPAASAWGAQASEAAPSPVAQEPLDPADLMPWELPEPAGVEGGGAGESAEWPPAPADRAPEPEAEATETVDAEEEPVDEDEDLEMFRSWLQSLKK